MTECPHCRALAAIETRGGAALCAVCGGPRIPGDFGGPRASAALVDQNKHLMRARMASIATVMQGFVATAVTLVALAIHPDTLAARVIAFAIALVPLGLAVRSRARAATARAEAKAAGEHAWQAAAEDIAAHTEGGITASALAKTLGIDADHADRLLTSLAVHDRTRVDVGDDAELRYSAAARVAGEDEEHEEHEEHELGSIDETPRAQKEPAR